MVPVVGVSIRIIGEAVSWSCLSHATAHSQMRQPMGSHLKCEEYTPKETEFTCIVENYFRFAGKPVSFLSNLLTAKA